MSTTSHGHGHDEPGADPESIAVGHELKDANPGPLILSAVGIGVLIVVSFIVMGIMLASTGNPLTATGNDVPTSPAMMVQLPPAPRLEQNPVVDGSLIVEQATKRIESYGWDDQQAGKAHIPIERAMELVLERGVGGQ
ncbi:hypothetical protein K2Z83_06915 [Oscillochloris sp. ZM17-4]|uniref:hypothetical protein n=1 Tax=Oscillochloris sp. ZM17-4 TaxID=2866714 RepID=UPI001C7308C3|nr:hypothetical protein [Oscillochloris sp. ZM17-4]MBX0327406.1 hypothetical protein [Oscillochloris sp. ZM17-4]